GNIDAIVLVQEDGWGSRCHDSANLTNGADGATIRPEYQRRKCAVAAKSVVCEFRIRCPEQPSAQSYPRKPKIHSSKIIEIGISMVQTSAPLRLCSYSDTYGQEERSLLGGVPDQGSEPRP